VEAHGPHLPLSTDRIIAEAMAEEAAVRLTAEGLEAIILPALDFTAAPFMLTVHAPHCAVSQPTCVPVMRRCSRMNVTSKVRSSTSPDTALPFTFMETLTDISPPPSTKCRFALALRQTR
jgi:hypothetical protein